MIIGDDLAESFCLIPSESEPAPSMLEKENVALKLEMDEMRRQLAEADRVLQLRKEQDQLLRDSIVMARHQVKIIFFFTSLTRWHSHTEFILGTEGYGSFSCPATTRWTAANCGYQRA